MKKILLALIVGLTLSRGLSAMMFADFDLLSSHTYIQKDTGLDKKIEKLSEQLMQLYVDYYEPTENDLSSYKAQKDSLNASKLRFTNQFEQWKEKISAEQINNSSKLQNLLVCLKEMREIEISLKKYQIETDEALISLNISTNSFNKDRKSYIRDKKDLIKSIASILIETKTKSYRNQFLQSLNPEYARFERARFMMF